jgi:hypothetical protein
MMTPIDPGNIYRKRAKKRARFAQGIRRGAKVLNESWQRISATGTTAAWLTVLFKYRRWDACGRQYDCGR